MNAISHISSDADLLPGPGATDGTARSWRRMIWQDGGPAESSDKVIVWIAEPGTYTYPGRDLEEIFVVLEGEGMMQIDDGAAEAIGPGSIVRIAKGAASSLRVTKPLRKVACVLPRP